MNQWMNEQMNSTARMYESWKQILWYLDSFCWANNHFPHPLRISQLTRSLMLPAYMVIYSTTSSYSWLSLIQGAGSLWGHDIFTLCFMCECKKTDYQPQQGYLWWVLNTCMTLLGNLNSETKANVLYIFNELAPKHIHLLIRHKVHICSFI